MNRTHWINWIWILTALFLVSCASEMKRPFYVSAIDTEEKEVTCIIFQDDQLLLDNQSNEAIRTPATIEIDFGKEVGGRYQKVKLGVRGVKVENGKITRGLREGEEYPYLEDANSWRMISSNDAKNQLFILRKNKDFEG